MSHNPILDELHTVRESMLAEAGGTLAGLVEMLQRQEQESDRHILEKCSLPRHRGTVPVKSSSKPKLQPAGSSSSGNSTQ